MYLVCVPGRAVRKSNTETVVNCCQTLYKSEVELLKARAGLLLVDSFIMAKIGIYFNGHVENPKTQRSYWVFVRH